MPEPTSPAPWTPGADPTTELPPEFNDGLPGAIPRAPRDYLEVGQAEDVESSHWPPVVDAVVRYAPVGTASTWARLVRYVTVHPDAHRVDQLWTAGHRGQAEELASEQAAVLVQRKVKVAAGAVALVVAGWVLIGAHGMWPLFVASLVLPAWYTMKGRALVRQAAKGTGQPEAGPPWESRPAPPAGAQDRFEDHPEDHRTGPRGLLRLVHLDRSERTDGPDADRTTEVRRTGPTPARPDPGPSPLTQDRVERALLKAVPKLDKVKPEIEGEPAVKVLASKYMGNGWAVTVGLPEEVPASEVVPSRHRIAGAFSTHQRGVPDSCVILIPDQGNPRLLTLWLCDQDPLAGPPTWSRLDQVDQVDTFDDIRLGLSLFGDDIVINLVGCHLRISGDTGSGKTRLGLLIAAHVAKDPHHKPIFIDPKNMGTWDPFAEIGEFYGGRSSFPAVRDCLRRIVKEEFEARSEKIAAFRKLYPAQMTESAITRAIAQDPAWDMPLLTIFIDEIQVLLRDSEVGSECSGYLEEIVELGRALGIQIIGLSQKMSGKKMPTDVRDIFTSQAAGSVQTPEAATMALGPEWRARGMNPVSLKAKVNSGAFYLQGDVLAPSGLDWVLFRGDFIDDNGIRLIARQCLEMRLRVRPELLPSAPKHPSGPKLTKDPAPAPSEPLDLAPLRRIVEILEPNGTMLATAVIGELANRWPGEHGNVQTVADLNRLLARYPLTGERLLRTKQPPQDDGTKPHRLSYGPCAHRLRALEARSEHLPERPDGD